jgi:hypothetical protein
MMGITPPLSLAITGAIVAIETVEALRDISQPEVLFKLVDPPEIGPPPLRHFNQQFRAEKGHTYRLSLFVYLSSKARAKGLAGAFAMTSIATELQKLEIIPIQTTPEVSNLLATQRQDTGLVDINYDLFDAEQNTINISFEFWDGSQWRPAHIITGDGSQPVGKGGKAVWDAKQDFSGNFSDCLRIKVIANDGQPSDNIVFSESSCFRLDTKAPENVGGSSPADGAKDIPVATSLVATNASDNSPVQYQFILAEDPNFTQGRRESGWQDSNTWTPGMLKPGQKYWWQVQARDSYGNLKVGQALSFTTKSEVSPPFPCQFPDFFERNEPAPLSLLVRAGKEGELTIEDGALSLRALSMGYDVYAWCKLPSTDIGNFDVSVKIKLESDSSPATNFGIGFYGGNIDPVTGTAPGGAVIVWYDGLMRQWVVAEVKVDEKRIQASPIELGKWVGLSVQRSGDTLLLIVNQKEVWTGEVSWPDNIEILALFNGIGVSGSTHVHYDDLMLTEVEEGKVTGRILLQGWANDHSIALITIDGHEVHPGSDGKFNLLLPSHIYSVTASAPGFLPASISNVKVSAGGTTTLPDVILLAGDANQDGKVDISDLGIIADNLGGSVLLDPRADINGDGEINLFDLVLTGANFGKNHSPW